RRRAGRARHRAAAGADCTRCGSPRQERDRADSSHRAAVAGLHRATAPDGSGPFRGEGMTISVRRAVVIRSGTTGGRLAAPFANAGVPVYLLDISQPIVTASLERLKKAKPPAFFTPETAELVTIGNLVDHESWIGEGDWIVEAIVEE